jgi:hypothetical protein
MSDSGLCLPRRRYLSSFTALVRPRRKFGEVPDDLIASHEPCGACTIEPGIRTDLPRRTVVGATAELHTEGEALRVEIVAGKQCRGTSRALAKPGAPKLTSSGRLSSNQNLFDNGVVVALPRYVLWIQKLFYSRPHSRRPPPKDVRSFSNGFSV